MVLCRSAWTLFQFCQPVGWSQESDAGTRVSLPIRLDVIANFEWMPMGVLHGTVVDVGTVDLHHSVVGALYDRVSVLVMSGMAVLAVRVIGAHQVRLKSALRIGYSIH